MPRLEFAPRTLPLPGGEALHSQQSTREIERRAAAELPPHTLMQRAGQATASLALALAPHAARILIVCGPGNNGGDGFEAAVHLHAAGKAVQVWRVGDAARSPSDAAASLARARHAGVPISTDEPPPDAGFDLAIDALLGLGARPAPEGVVGATMARLATLRCEVLSVDLPSGLDADTGQPIGKACVRAAHTLALLTLKPGLFTGMGRDAAGRVWYSDLGVQAQVAPDAWLSGLDAADMAPRRHAQHKGSFGNVAVIGGAAGMTGAAWLAARAAHAAGAGRVFVSLLDPQASLLDPVRPELMGRARWWETSAARREDTVVVCGCGGAGAVHAALAPLLGSSPRLALDADALNAVAADPTLQRQLEHRAARGRQSVLTPHPLEAARLLGCSTEEVQADRLAAAQALAQRFACIVVLKGSGTVIATPQARPAINPTGDARLSTAGTGDVLAGWLAGIWAQGLDARAAAIAAVWQHGAAADALDQRIRVLRATDLIERMALTGDGGR